MEPEDLLEISFTAVFVLIMGAVILEIYFPSIGDIYLDILPDIIKAGFTAVLFLMLFLVLASAISEIFDSA